MRKQKQSLAPVLILIGITLLAVMFSFSKPETVQAETFDLSSAVAKYPNIASTSLNSCELCHTTDPDLNPYGAAYLAAGRNDAAFGLIENLDSDNDGYTNIQEIRDFLTFPGDPASVPTVATATRTAVPTFTFTSVPPTFTFTSVPPTATFTSVPPTATFTSVPPTATFTSVPPTATFTSVPPTATFTSVPPTATFTSVPPTATFTSVPPTATFTSVPPTATFTSVPPTATFTSVPPTATFTLGPPTATFTSVPPTATFTSVPPTATFTSVPPTATFTSVPPTFTFTSVPPTATFTSVPPTPTSTPPASNTPGKVTGGGNANFTDGKITFGFVVKYSKGALNPAGNLIFKDHGSNVSLKATSFTLLSISGNRAVITGYGTVNGEANMAFTVTVEDSLTPRSSDTFMIQIPALNGYSVGGVLSGGKIQISTTNHKHESSLKYLGGLKKLFMSPWSDE